MNCIDFIITGRESLVFTVKEKQAFRASSDQKVKNTSNTKGVEKRKSVYVICKF